MELENGLQLTISEAQRTALKRLAQPFASVEEYVNSAAVLPVEIGMLSPQQQNALRYDPNLPTEGFESALIEQGKHSLYFPSHALYAFDLGATPDAFRTVARAMTVPLPKLYPIVADILQFHRETYETRAAESEGHFLQDTPGGQYGWAPSLHRDVKGGLNPDQPLTIVYTARSSSPMHVIPDWIWRTEEGRELAVRVLDPQNRDRFGRQQLLPEHIAELKEKGFYYQPRPYALTAHIGELTDHASNRPDVPVQSTLFSLRLQARRTL